MTGTLRIGAILIVIGAGLMTCGTVRDGEEWSDVLFTVGLGCMMLAGAAFGRLPKKDKNTVEK